jgi:hypothetical protein
MFLLYSESLPLKGVYGHANKVAHVISCQVLLSLIVTYGTLWFFTVACPCMACVIQSMWPTAPNVALPKPATAGSSTLTFLDCQSSPHS